MSTDITSVSCMTSASQKKKVIKARFRLATVLKMLIISGFGDISQKVYVDSYQSTDALLKHLLSVGSIRFSLPGIRNRDSGMLVGLGWCLT